MPSKINNIILVRSIVCLLSVKGNVAIVNIQIDWLVLWMIVQLFEIDRLIDTCSLIDYHWLIDWLVDWSTDWVIDWLTTGWLAGWLVDLTNWLAGWWTDWLIGWLTDWLTNRQNDWLIDWLIDISDCRRCSWSGNCCLYERTDKISRTKCGDNFLRSKYCYE